MSWTAKVCQSSAKIAKTRLTIALEGPPVEADVGLAISYEHAFRNSFIDTWAVAVTALHRSRLNYPSMSLLVDTSLVERPLTPPVRVTLFGLQPAVTPITISSGDFLFLEKFEAYVDERCNPSLRCCTHKSAWYVWNRGTMQAHTGVERQHK